MAACPEPLGARKLPRAEGFGAEPRCRPPSQKLSLVPLSPAAKRWGREIQGVRGRKMSRLLTSTKVMQKPALVRGKVVGILGRTALPPAPKSLFPTPEGEQRQRENKECHQ